MKAFRLLLLVAVGFAGGYVVTRVHFPGQVGSEDRSRTAREQLPETIRIATANFGPLDENKLRKPGMLGRLAQAIQQFDIVALQGIQGRDQGVLVQLRDEVNATPGRHYAFATAPHAGSDSAREYLAFMFNEDTVDGVVETVADRSGVLSHTPLVAAFRARKPNPSEAFTFKLINVQVSPDRVAAEVNQLAQVFRKVRDAYPEEDDIILLGDLETDNLGQLGRVPHIAAVAANVPTTTRGTRLADNILYDRQATTEYTLRWGVYDIMREYNLPSVRETVEISEHLPVWAEFSVYEGGPTRPAPPGP